MKKTLICLLGVVLSFVFLSLFVSVDSSFGAQNTDPWARLVASQFRFNWIYNPAITMAVSIVVSAIDMSKFRVPLSVMSVVPFILSFMAAGAPSFVSANLGFSFLYLSVAVFSSYMVGRVQRLCSNRAGERTSPA